MHARCKKDGLTLETLLTEIQEGWKELLQVSKPWITKVESSSSTREAYKCTKKAKEGMRKAFISLIDGLWMGIMELQYSLRNTPMEQLHCLAVVFVGMPNVGKFLIVWAISSGMPKMNNYPFATCGVTLGHVCIFCKSERQVALGNITGVSTPSKRQLIQERLVEGCKDKKRKNDNNDAREEKRQHNCEGDEGLGGANAIRIDSNDNNARWGDVGEGVPHCKAASPLFSSDGGGDVSNKICPISQLCQIMDSPGLLQHNDGQSATRWRS